MSYGAVVHAALAERTEAQRARAERSGRAEALIRSKLPEFVIDGHVCPWGLWALVELWDELGEGKATAQQTRERRRVKLARFKEQRGYDPYEQMRRDQRKGAA